MIRALARLVQRLCPHPAWSNAPRVRFCRLCGARQRLIGGIWVETFPVHLDTRSAFA